MKIVNRILCVLVLISAAAAAVFAFLLFQKRNQMIAGWNQMASAIHKTAAALDANSGTKLAAELDEQKLTHKQSLDELQKNLEKLIAGTRAVVAQRNGLADTLVATAAKVEITTDNPQALKDLSRTEAKQQAILKSTQQIRGRNDKVLQSYIAAGKSIGIKGQDLEAIKKDGGADAFEQQIRAAIAQKDARINTCQDELAKIGSQVNVRFERDQYALSAAKIRSAVMKQRQSVRKLEVERASLQRKYTAEQARAEKLNRENAASKVTIKEQKAEMDRRHKKYNPSKNPIVDDYVFNRTPLRTLYAKVRGKISKVDEKWGVVVINIGRSYDVRRPVENKILSDLVKIEKDRNMTVVRNASSASPKVIGKIRISSVLDTYSVGNVLNQWQVAAVQEGDDVIFTDDDLDGFLPKENKAAK